MKSDSVVQQKFLKGRFVFFLNFLILKSHFDLIQHLKVMQLKHDDTETSHIPSHPQPHGIINFSSAFEERESMHACLNYLN